MLDVALKKNYHTLFKLLNYPMWLHYVAIVSYYRVVTTHSTLFDSLK